MAKNSSVRRAVKKVLFTVLPNSSREREKVIASLLAGCETLLDVGCGRGESFGELKLPRIHKDGVELSHADAEEARRSGQYATVFEHDVRDTAFIKNKSYDAVLCINLIEHMSKMNGLSLVAEMERIARKVVIIETPNGFLPSNEAHARENEFQRHLSGWEPYEFAFLGYSVMGLFGHKLLRKVKLGDHITDKMVRHRPSQASVLLAYKKLSDLS